MTSSDEMFAEAANNWDLERLYKAMAEAKWQVSPRSRKGLTEREKLFLRGLLCGHSPAEIASQLHQSRKGVEVYISKTLYQYFKKITDVPNEKVSNWRNIHNCLEEAGYKTMPSVKSHSSNYSPQIPLVNIVNISLNNQSHSITIDIHLQLTLPSLSDPTITEDMDTKDRPDTNQSN
ncbi:helix-turn-helix transcriptional regulator [Microcoleus sp. B4-D4]|uniref:helix-turn-helix transcriptional regulator n=1 Tax=Microcoleus sp. B4-D4 TaxID=2818667 RepID=UPI002FD6EDE4